MFEAAAETQGISCRLRMSPLFLKCSESKGHPKTGSFCFWIRGTAHMWFYLRSTPSNGRFYLCPHRIRTCNSKVNKVLPLSWWPCEKKSKGKMSLWDTPRAPFRLLWCSKQTAVVKLCVFWENVEVLGSDTVVFKGKTYPSHSSTAAVYPVSQDNSE